MRYWLLSLAGWLAYLIIYRPQQVLSALISYGKLQSLRMKGHAIGNNVRLGRNADILVVGTGKVQIGSGTEIAEFSQIVVEDGASLIIGEQCFLSRNILLGCSSEIVIGDYVAIGGYGTIIDINKRYDDLGKLIVKQGRESKPIWIERDTWLGANVTLLAGTHIGPHCVIGACSLVRGTIPSGSVAVGSPARVIKTLEAAE